MRFNKTMNMEQKIKDTILKDIAPQQFEVVNESHLHSGHAGDDGSGQTHFKLIITASIFTGLSRVQRQRLVNKALKECFEEGLHAVSMQLNTV